MKDESKRRAYDINYRTTTRREPPQTNEQTYYPYRPPPTSTAQAKIHSDEEQISILRKAQQQRNARWQSEKKVFDSFISDVQKGIRWLESEIARLESICTAEAAEDEDARKDKWKTWFHKKTEGSQKEEEVKQRQRQERAKDLSQKRERLHLRNAELERQEDMLMREQVKVDTANLADARAIEVLQARIRQEVEAERLRRQVADGILKEQQEKDRVKREEAAWQQEKEKLEREEEARMWQRFAEQQEETEILRREQKTRILNEQLRRDRLERQAAAERLKVQREAERLEREEAARIWQRFSEEQEQQHQAQQAMKDNLCRHEGLWIKDIGRTECSKCHEVWVSGMLVVNDRRNRGPRKTRVR